MIALQAVPVIALCVVKACCALRTVVVYALLVYTICFTAARWLELSVCVRHSCL
jgi:hypothetical protein